MAEPLAALLALALAAAPVPPASPAQAPVPSASPAQAPVPSVSPSQAPVPSASPAQAPVPSASPAQAPVPSASPETEPASVVLEAPDPALAVVEGPERAPTPDLVAAPPGLCHGSRPCKRLVILASVTGGLGLAAVIVGGVVAARPQRVDPDDPTLAIAYRPAGAATLAIGLGVLATGLLMTLASVRASRHAKKAFPTAHVGERRLTRRHPH